MDGYAGTILTVNLSDGRVTKEPLREDLVEDYIGGEPLGTRLLWERFKPGTDALSPESPLIISTTPFTGTQFPPGGRLFANYKSPLTGFWGQNGMGGGFAPALKRAGYDVLIVEGKAEKPVYIFIDNDKVEIRDASQLWGKLCGETDELLRDEIGDRRIEIVRIGPAGENLNRLSCIMSGYNHAFGSGGNGAVAGSKNLKAIAVRGRGDVSVHDRAGFSEIARTAYKVARERASGTIGKYQIHVLNAAVAMTNGIPSHHWQQAYWDKGDVFYGDNILEKLYTGEDTFCPGCPIRAGKVLSPKSGPYAGHKLDVKIGADWSWGYQLMTDDLDTLCEIWYQCAQNGIDINSAGEWAGWLAECQERGILTTKDCGGLEVRFGDAESALSMLHAIVKREGFGDVLAEGPKIAAERVGKGTEKYVMHGKGQPLASEEFRALPSMLLGTAVEERGGNGHRCWTHHIFLIGNLNTVITGLTEKPDQMAQKGISKWVKAYKQALPGILNSIGGCVVIWWSNALETAALIDGYRCLTGRDMSIEKALHVGERSINLARAFNCREGFSRKDDAMPERFLKEPVNGGPRDGARIDDFDGMIDEYYTEAGFDLETGWPTRAKLEELELKDVADELYAKGK